MTKTAEEIREMHEHLPEEQTEERLRIVITMSAIAVLIAVISLLGHRAHTREILFQDRAGDQWVYYQSEKDGVENTRMFLRLLSGTATQSADAARSVQQEFEKKLQQHQEEATRIEGKARAMESTVAHEEHVADRFDLGEVCLEAALVIVSITLVVRRRLFWMFGLTVALAGLLFAITGFFVSQ